MDGKLKAKLLASLPKTRLTDPEEIELRFLTGSADLAAFGQVKKHAIPPGFSDAETILKFIRKFSNLPNMLKKQKELAALFTEAARKQAKVALLSTPYLGVDTAARDYFLPLEFRIYWALMIGVSTKSKDTLNKIVEQVTAKKLIRNSEEFQETLARIL